MNIKKLAVISVAAIGAVTIVFMAGNKTSGVVNEPKQKVAQVAAEEKPKPEPLAAKPEVKPEPVKEVKEVEPEPVLTDEEIAKEKAEEALRKRKLLLGHDDFTRLRDADTVSLLEVAFTKGASGNYISQLKTLQSDLELEINTQSDSYVIFASENDRSEAEKILQITGILATSINQEAVSRRMICAVDRCLGSLSAFPKIVEEYQMRNNVSLIPNADVEAEGS